MARKSKLEKDFEADFMEELDQRLPGGMWLKGNSAMRQGVPDRLYLNGPHWALLEFKRDGSATKQPNQEYYVELFDSWSFARIVTPENAQEVLDEIQAAFGG